MPRASDLEMNAEIREDQALQQKYPLIISSPQLPPAQKGWEKLFNRVSWDLANVTWCYAWLH